MSKQKEKPGSIVIITIDNGYHIYARVLNYGDLAFYDKQYDYTENDLHSIVNQPILFKAIVNEGGVKYGRWRIIGFVPLENDLQESKYYLSMGSDSECGTYINGVVTLHIPKNNCKGMESGAVWDPELIENRIRDHYNGVSNYFGLQHPRL